MSDGIRSSLGAVCNGLLNSEGRLSSYQSHTLRTLRGRQYQYSNGSVTYGTEAEHTKVISAVHKVPTRQMRNTAIAPRIGINVSGIFTNVEIRRTWSEYAAVVTFSICFI